MVKLWQVSISAQTSLRVIFSLPVKKLLELNLTESQNLYNFHAHSFLWILLNSWRKVFSLWVSKFVCFIDCIAPCTEGQVCCLLNYVAYMEHSCVIRLLVLWNELRKTNCILHQGFKDFPTIKEPLQILGISRVIRSRFEGEEPWFWSDLWTSLLSGIKCLLDVNWYKFFTWGEKLQYFWWTYYEPFAQIFAFLCFTDFHT
jgi:hypothetical protein